MDNGISLYFGYFGSQAEQEQAMYMEWIGTIVCVGSQAEQVKKECVGVLYGIGPSSDECER